VAKPNPKKPFTAIEERVIDALRRHAMCSAPNITRFPRVKTAREVAKWTPAKTTSGTLSPRLTLSVLEELRRRGVVDFNADGWGIVEPLVAKWERVQFGALHSRFAVGDVDHMTIGHDDGDWFVVFENGKPRCESLVAKTEQAARREALAMLRTRLEAARESLGRILAAMAS
jgi:hypothetical protein